MAKVVAPEGFALELDSERMTFGHSTEIEVPLLPELGVAERQFTIVRFGVTHFIEHRGDQEAPTKVNGTPITKHPLQDGDEISAGDLVLIFQEHDEELGEREDSSAEARGPRESLTAVAKLPVAEGSELATAAGELPGTPLGEAPATASPTVDSRAIEALEPEETSSPGLPPLAPQIAVDKPSDLPPASESVAVAAAPELELEPDPIGADLPVAPEPQRFEASPVRADEEDAEDEKEEEDCVTAPALTESLAGRFILGEELVDDDDNGMVDAGDEAADDEAAALPAAAKASESHAGAGATGFGREEPPATRGLPALPSPTHEPLPSAAEATEVFAEGHGIGNTLQAQGSVPEMAPSPSPDEVEVSVPPAAKPPGRETQRINLASAISSALTPQKPLAEAGGAAVAATGSPPLADPHPHPQAAAQAQREAGTPPAGIAQAAEVASPTPPPVIATEAPTLPTPPPAPRRSFSAIEPPSAAVPPAASPSPQEPSAAPISAPAPDPAPQGVMDAVPQQSLSVASTADPGASLPDAGDVAPAPTRAKSKPARKSKRRSSSKRIKLPKPKRQRQPLFPFLRVAIPGAITLAALLGGAYYAWENYFKPAEKSPTIVYRNEAPKAFPKAEIKAPDILRFLPENAEKAAYIDAQAGFGIWSATMNPSGDPTYNPVDDFIMDATGVGLSQLDYVCIAGDAEIQKFVAVIGFGIDLDPAELYTGIERIGSRLLRVETIGGLPLRILRHEGLDLELVLIDGRTVLVSSAGQMRETIKNSTRSEPNYGPVLRSLGEQLSAEAAFAMISSSGALDLGAILETLACPAPEAMLEQIAGAEAIALTAVAKNDIDLSISFLARDPQRAAAIPAAGADWLKGAPQKLKDGLSQEFPDGQFPAALDRMLGSARWEVEGNASQIRLDIPRRDIPDVIRAFKPHEINEVEADLSRRDAQEFASLFATGIACGNPDLPKAGSVKRALELLVDGVQVNDQFGATEVKFPFRPEPDELDAISRHLSWQDQLLVFTPSAR